MRLLIVGANGTIGTAAATWAPLAYARSVEGAQTGRVFVVS